MIGEFFLWCIIWLVGALGAWLLKKSYSKLLAIRIFYELLDLHYKVVQIMLYLAIMTIGIWLVLLCIFVPAALGTNMDIFFFVLIILSLYGFYNMVYPVPIKLKSI